MTIYDLSLNREDNPEFYGLADEHEALMKRWNRHNNQLHRFGMPVFLLCGTKRRLVSIGRKINCLGKDVLAWQERARNFCINPRYTVPPDQPGHLVFLHATSIIRDLETRMESNLSLLEDNYNRMFSERRHQINFLIAITGLVSSLIGLLWAVEAYRFFAHLSYLINLAYLIMQCVVSGLIGLV